MGLGFYPMTFELQHRNRGKSLRVRTICVVGRHRMQTPIVYSWPLAANICVLDTMRCCCSIRRTHNLDISSAMIAPHTERVLVSLSRASNNVSFLSLRHYSRLSYAVQVWIDATLVCAVSFRFADDFNIFHIKLAPRESICMPIKTIPPRWLNCFTKTPSNTP